MARLEDRDGAPAGAETYDIGFFDAVCRRPCWRDSAGRLVAPDEVIAFPDFHAGLWRAVGAADPAVPIVIRAGTEVILEGLDRLARRRREGAPDVLVRFVRPDEFAGPGRHAAQASAAV